MSTYLGYDVLDQASHNMRESIKEAFSRHGALLGSGTGRRYWDDYAGQAFPVRSFTWTAFGRTEVAALRAFIDARKGRVMPFWTPSYGAELPLAAAAASGDSTLKIAAIGFSRFLYPVTARRYLAISKPDGSFLPAKIVAAADNGDGTETLNLSATLTEDVPVARLVSFLVLCRLDTDDVSIHWQGTGFAEATMPFREVPLEVPV